eukprot:31210-Pelagococcus_subviridis.AAC.13
MINRNAEQHSPHRRCHRHARDSTVYHRFRECRRLEPGVAVAAAAREESKSHVSRSHGFHVLVAQELAHRRFIARVLPVHDDGDPTAQQRREYLVHGVHEPHRGAQTPAFAPLHALRRPGGPGRVHYVAHVREHDVIALRRGRERRRSGARFRLRHRFRRPRGERRDVRRRHRRRREDVARLVARRAQDDHAVHARALDDGAKPRRRPPRVERHERGLAGEDRDQRGDVLRGGIGVDADERRKRAAVAVASRGRPRARAREDRLQRVHDRRRVRPYRAVRHALVVRVVGVRRASQEQRRFRGSFAAREERANRRPDGRLRVESVRGGDARVRGGPGRRGDVVVPGRALTSLPRHGD